MMVSGDKAKVERYLNERYGGTFEVIVPGDPISSRSHGSVLKFPVWAYNTEDPEVLFAIYKNKGGERYYGDTYAIVLFEKQIESILNTALADVGIQAVSSVYISFREVDSENLPVGISVTDYFMDVPVETIDMLLKIAICSTNINVDELESGLTKVFSQIDEVLCGKEKAAYDLFLVETDDFEALAQEIKIYGIDYSNLVFANGRVVSKLKGDAVAWFNHEGHKRPIRDNLESLLKGK
jgi:hypothetical protein